MMVFTVDIVNHSPMPVSLDVYYNLEDMFQNETKRGILVYVAGEEIENNKFRIKEVAYNKYDLSKEEILAKIEKFKEYFEFY